MKFKKVFAAVLALVSFMNAPISALAYIDVTETVRANSGEHIDVGSVTVENSNVAVDVYTSDKAASVDVAGDVSLKTNDLGAVVSVEGDYASANIAGDVTGDAGNMISGIKAQGSANNNTTTTVEVDGDVTVFGGNYAIGVTSSDADIEIGKDINVDGKYATGISFSSIKEANASVSSINVSGEYVTGAVLTSYAEGNASGNVTLDIVGDLTVSASSEETPGANGIILSNNGGEIHANVMGNIEVDALDGEAYGIITSYESLPTISESTNEVKVDGDIISTGVGIHYNDIDESVSNTIAVNGTILADDVAILLDDENIARSNLNLVVWKIVANENGNYAEKIEIEENEKVRSKAANFEKSINYIIKAEQPEEGARIRLSSEEELVVAKAGEKVTFSVDLENGYDLLGAYNGEKEKVKLNKDEAGNYYVIVPNGGGVYLSLILATKTSSVPVNNKTGVAGVRTGRAAGGVLGVGVQEETKEREVPEVEKNDDDSSAQATTLEDETLAGAQGVEEGASMWWVWLLIVLAAAAGYGVYKYADTKKKAANTNEK